MQGKYFLRAVSVKAKRFLKIDKKLAKSYVSLFLVLLLILTSTFAWFTKLNVARMNTGNLEFQSASSLRINKEKTNSNRITIPAFTLDEASSLDGRNIYFPLGASFNGVTKDMFFREGNMGDENERYVYKNFTLKGTSGNTPVYIKSYEIKIEEADSPHDPEVNATYHDQLTVGYDAQGRPSTQTIPHHQCPVRLAFIADSGVNPVVIDPSAQVVDYVDNSNGAVSLIDENGSPETKNTYPDCGWNSFASYYYGNTPLFVIPGGETLNVTLVIWLEGTLPECHKYIGKKISVDIDIESNFAEMETIIFYDDTQPDNSGGQTHWVSNNDSYGSPIIACSYKDPFSDEGRYKTVIMKKMPNDDEDSTTKYKWTAKIPKKAVTDISFYRLSRANGSTQSTIYNSWHTTKSISTWITASSIPNDWYSSGDLQQTRQILDESSGTYYNALIYTAVHGNGYGVTGETPKRLAPCVGYWNYTGGSGGGSSGGAGQQGSGGASTYNVAVIVDAKYWVGNNVRSGSKLHFTTSGGGDYEYTKNPSGDHFEQTFTLNANDEITGFYVKHPNNSTTPINVNSIFTVTRNVNVVYTQQNDDSLTPNLDS